MTSTGQPTPRRARRYTSTRRARQAEQTRGDVLRSAARLFARAGWAGTTLAAIAADADVAVDTIYTGFASKKALLQAAMDVAITGDAEPVPLLDRERGQRLRALPREQRLREGIDWVGDIYAGPLVGVWSAMLEAAASDREVAAWCDDHEQRRRATVAAFLDIVCDRPAPDTVVDSVWAVTSMEVYAKLTRQRGWTGQQWKDWAINTIHQLLP